MGAGIRATATTITAESSSSRDIKKEGTDPNLQSKSVLPSKAVGVKKESTSSADKIKTENSDRASDSKSNGIKPVLGEGSGSKAKETSEELHDYVAAMVKEILKPYYSKGAIDKVQFYITSVKKRFVKQNSYL